MTMTGQGCSTFSTDESNRVLDRLAGLEKIITPAQMMQALVATGRVNRHRCKLNNEVMLWVVLAMGLFTTLPIRQVFKQARRLRNEEKSPPRSSLCEGRKRLGVEPIKYLHEHVVRPLATPETPGAFWRGWRWVGIDGSVYDVPDGPANAEAFSRATGSRGDGAFPQVRKASLVELGTHVELAIEIGGWQDGEQTLARKLWDRLPTDSLLVEDRGFFNYADWKELDRRGQKLLVRVKSHMVLESFQSLSDGSYLAKIYRSSYDRDKDRGGIVVRVIAYTLDDPQRTGHQEEHRFITNLLDKTQYPAMELIVGYHERWEHEGVYDEQKTHQDPRRAEKPANLRSETPEGVRQELYALSLAHFVVRSLMFEAARPAPMDVDRLSFVGCFRILQCRLPECLGTTAQTFEEWLESVLWEMRQEVIEARRNRTNPRVIKRKMSKWPKKRAKHRNLPPLKKQFVESVVMNT
jgi:Insertion element 4 transposase N-terminal/Transposase DDE domain